MPRRRVRRAFKKFILGVKPLVNAARVCARVCCRVCVCVLLCDGVVGGVLGCLLWLGWVCRFDCPAMYFGVLKEWFFNYCVRDSRVKKVFVF